MPGLGDVGQLSNGRIVEAAKTADLEIDILGATQLESESRGDFSQFHS